MESMSSSMSPVVSRRWPCPALVAVPSLGAVATEVEAVRATAMVAAIAMEARHLSAGPGLFMSGGFRIIEYSLNIIE